MKNKFIVILTVLLLCAAVFAACGDGGPPDGAWPVAVIWTGLTANGEAGVTDTTEFTLAFNINPTALTAAHITVTGAEKGALSGTGTARRLAVSGITEEGQTVTVTISNPEGYTISGGPKSVAVYKAAEFVTHITVEWVELTANGTENITDTTELALTFDKSPDILTAEHIAVTGAGKGELTGTGTIRKLFISGITVDEGETVTVTISNPEGYTINGGPKSVAVHKKMIEQPVDKKLAAPKNVNIGNNVISWNTSENILIWGAVENADTYRVTFYINGENFDAFDFKETEEDFAPYAYSRLPVGEYTAAVKALANGEYSESDESVPVEIIVIALPELTPPGLQIEDGVLTWDKADNSESYRVTVYTKEKYADKEPFVSWPFPASQVRFALEEKMAVEKGAESGKYKVTVTAMAAGGRVSVESEPIEYTYQRLAAPQNLKIEDGYLTWSAVNDAACYLIWFYQGGKFVYKYIENTEIDLTEDVVFWLAPGEYTVTVSAYKFLFNSSSDIGIFKNSSDESEPSEYTHTGLSRLGTPQNIQIRGGFLSWEGVNGADKYIVSVYTADGERLNDLWVFSENSVDLEWELYAVYETGPGDYTATVKAYGDGYIPSFITMPIEFTVAAWPQFRAPENLQIEDGVLTWEEVRGAGWYTVTVYTPDQKIFMNWPSLETEFDLERIITDNKAETGEYTVTVTATTGNGSFWAESESIDYTYRRLAAPENLQIVDGVLTWGAVERVTAYIVTYYKEGIWDSLSYVSYVANVENIGINVATDPSRPPGEYTVTVRAVLGNNIFSGESEPIAYTHISPFKNAAELIPGVPQEISKGTYFKIVCPAGGIYTFYSFDNNNWGQGALLYDSDYKVLDLNYDGGKDLNFRIVWFLQEGETYYLHAWANYGVFDGKFSVAAVAGNAYDTVFLYLKDGSCAAFGFGGYYGELNEAEIDSWLCGLDESYAGAFAVYYLDSSESDWKASGAEIVFANGTAALDPGYLTSDGGYILFVDYNVDEGNGLDLRMFFGLDPDGFYYDDEDAILWWWIGETYDVFLAVCAALEKMGYTCDMPKVTGNTGDEFAEVEKGGAEYVVRYLDGRYQTTCIYKLA